MRKVLIISYYWPPSGGGGVQRWLKTAKYLPEYGWEPIVCVPSNPAYPIEDDSFLEEAKSIRTIKAPIWEPSRFLAKFGGKNTAKLNEGFVADKQSLWKEFVVAVRGNLFIPDARRFWIKPALKRIEELLKKEKVDLVVSTGPPHTCHLIAMKVKSKHQLPWLADFRDPWTNIDFYQELNLSNWADRKHRRLEKLVLSSADQVVTVGETLSRELNELGATGCAVVTNGFDQLNEAKQASKTFNFLHIGRLGAARSPKVFWEAVASLKNSSPEAYEAIRIDLIGNVDGTIKQEVERLQLGDKVRFRDSVPNAEALTMQVNSFALLLLINDTPNAKGILTGKFFEYMSTGRPILGIGPVDGDAAKIMRDCNAGDMFAFNDQQGLENGLIQLFQRFEVGDTGEFTAERMNYSRKSLTGKMVKNFEQALGK